MIGRIKELSIDYLTNKGKVLLEIPKNELEYIEELKDKDINIELKEHHKKRSLNANGYCWVLIQDIADRISSTKEQVYRKFIKEKGIFRTIEVDNKALSTILYLWEDKGLGWVYDILEKRKDRTEVILYYGTSSYNSKQMSNFIDYVVEEAKALGIQTLTPKELSLLKEKW